MSKKKIMMKVRRIMAFPDYILRRLPGRELPESVYYFTFHKCASTLFSGYVLKNMKGLQHVNYARQIYSGEKGADKTLLFKDRGCVYGPIRLSADPMSAVYRLLVTPTSEPEFIRNKIGIFFVRDPRDILVSSYYSIGYTHGFSKVQEIRERQMENRNMVQQQSLDEYALEAADEQARNFEALGRLARACERGVIIKYEDMIHDFELFTGQLCRHVVVDKHVLQEIYQRSRPKQEEDKQSHRRSGKTEGFRSKLKKETIESLNSSLEKTLAEFGYQA